MLTKADQFRALSLSTIAFTACFAAWTVFSIIGIKIKSDLNLSDTQFGFLLAVPILSGSISRLFLGVWTDLYGGRLILTLTMLFSSLSIWLLSLAKTYEILLLVLLGAGLAGGSFAVGVSYLSKWYSQNQQGTVLGIFGAGNVGAAITSFVAPFLLVAFGWHATAQIYAYCLLALALIFFLVSKDDPETNERRLKKLPPNTFFTQLIPLKSIQVWRFSLYYFFVFGAFVALAIWLPRYYMGAYGLDITTAGLLTAAYALPGSIFRALGGHLSDKYGARAVMYWTFLVSIVVCFFLSYPNTTYIVDGIEGPIKFRLALSLPVFVLLTVVLGFFMSLGKAAVYKHIPIYFPNHVGAVGGAVGLVGGLGGFCLPIAFGFLNDTLGVWTSCFMLLFAIISVALIWMHVAILRLDGRLGKSRFLPEFNHKEPVTSRCVNDKKNNQPKMSVTNDLSDWDPEDGKQWTSWGKTIAFRNLWISVPALLCGFAIWLYWGIITVQMLNLGFPFAKSDLFSLLAIAGLSGATLRIPSTFFIRVAGGRNTIFLTTTLLILPAIGTGFALTSQTTPLYIFQALALLSGIGGGNFASSMSNISFFFPKRMQGLSLGLNAGLGNFGVTIMQILIPLVMTFGFFGVSSLTLKAASGTVIGKIPAGTETYIQNAGFIWALVLVPISALAWFGMNNIKAKHVSPDINHTLTSFAQIVLMLSIGLATAAAGLWFMLPVSAHGAGIMVSKFITLPCIVIITVVLLRALPGTIGGNLRHQYKIFKNPHTWIMTLIYSMTFGSFIGFSATFPLAIKIIFGFRHLVDSVGVHTHEVINPNSPSAFVFAWIGPFIGALIRPVGGLVADRLGGAFVTQVCAVLMLISTLGAAHYMKLAYSSATPEIYFLPFFFFFLLLFAATGIGNGSAFRTIAIVFDREQTGPVLGWTSAIAAYGAFMIPKVLGEQIKLTTPEAALYGFAAFYAFCMILNWITYLRPGVKYKNP